MEGLWYHDMYEEFAQFTMNTDFFIFHTSCIHVNIYVKISLKNSTNLYLDAMDTGMS